MSTTIILDGVIEDIETHRALVNAFLSFMTPAPKPEVTDPTLDKDGWPKRWSDPTYLGDGPWGP